MDQDENYCNSGIPYCTCLKCSLVAPAARGIASLSPRSSRPLKPASTQPVISISRPDHRLALYGVITLSGFVGFIFYAIPAWALLYLCIAIFGLAAITYESASFVRRAVIASVMPAQLHQMLTTTPLLELIRRAYYTIADGALAGAALVASFGLPRVRGEEAALLAQALPADLQQRLSQPVTAVLPRELQALYHGTTFLEVNHAAEPPAPPPVLGGAVVVRAFLVARVARLVRMLGRNALKLSIGAGASSMAIVWMKRFAPAALRRSQMMRLLIAVLAAVVGFGAAGMLERCAKAKRPAIERAVDSTAESAESVEMSESVFQQ